MKKIYLIALILFLTGCASNEELLKRKISDKMQSQEGFVVESLSKIICHNNTYNLVALGKSKGQPETQMLIVTIDCGFDVVSILKECEAWDFQVVVVP